MRDHLTKEKPHPWHKYDAKGKSEFYCQECHARVTVTNDEYGHLGDCSHRPKRMGKTW